jgi:hypothetical protein
VSVGRVMVVWPELGDSTVAACLQASVETTIGLFGEAMTERIERCWLVLGEDQVPAGFRLVVVLDIDAERGRFGGARSVGAE